MIKAYKWQCISFIKELQVLLNHIGGQNINFLEFRLLTDQFHMSFINSEEQERCISLFQKFGFISKKQLVSCLRLVSVVVKNNQKYSIVRLRKTNYELEHSHNRCFQFWIDLMKQKYGSRLIWFESLCQEKGAIRITIQNFLIQLSRILKGSQHQECAKKISQHFQKSKKNDVTFSVFMNTINIHRMTSSKMQTRVQSPKSTQRKLYRATNFQNDSLSGSRSLKSGLKTKWSMRSAKSRYDTRTPLNKTDSILQL